MRRLAVAVCVLVVAMLAAGPAMGASSDWAQRPDAPGPSTEQVDYYGPDIRLGGMAYDQISARMLLDVVDGVHGRMDTYAWGGHGAWARVATEILPPQPIPQVTELVPTPVPGIACRGQLIYDGATGTVERLGVRCAERWVGVAWVPAPQVGSMPSPGSAPPTALAYDPAHCRVVAVVGNIVGTFDGLIWTTHFLEAPAPQLAFDTALTYDPQTGAMLFVGESSLGEAQTWRLDGLTWTQLSPTTQPPLFSPDLITPAGASPLLVMPGAPGPGQTWRWTGGNWIEEQGTQPAGFGPAAWDPGLFGSVAVTEPETSATSPTPSQTWVRAGL